LFTAMVLEDLSRQAVHCEGHPGYRIDDHILLISSVSGGTLASACYVDDGYAGKTSDEPTPHRPRNFFPEETVALMVDALPTIQGRPWYEGFHHHDEWTEWWRAAEACCAPDEESR